MTTKVDGKNDNSLAEQGKVQNSTASKQVPMTTNVDGKNDETTAKHEDLKRERDLLLETARLAPDDAKADARKALVAFDHSHPKFAREIYDCATLSRKGLLVKVFSEGWKLYWPPFCEQAIEHEKSLAMTNAGTHHREHASMIFASHHTVSLEVGTGDSAEPATWTITTAKAASTRMASSDVSLATPGIDGSIAPGALLINIA